MTQQIQKKRVRQLMHTRRVTCEAYMREDGLIDIEGVMTDVKPETVNSHYRVIDADTPFHHMRLTVTVDQEFLIHDVLAETLASPTPVCGDITSAYRNLIGLRIGPGFKKAVAERVGGLAGCTHLTDLLGPMATALIQSTFALRQEEKRQRAQEDPNHVRPRPWVVGTCHAYHPDGDAALRIWPLKHRPK